MSFKLDQNAELKSVNIRGENHGDEPATGVDLRFHVEDVPVSTVFPLLGIDGDTAAEQAFLKCFWDDSVEDQRYSGIDKIVSWAEFEKSHHISGDLGPKETIHRLNKFEFKPRACGRVDLTFSCAIQEPGDDLIIQASHNVKGRVKIRIDHDPELALAPSADGTEQEDDDV